jgi:hypothetical protein
VLAQSGKYDRVPEFIKGTGHFPLNCYPGATAARTGQSHDGCQMKLPEGTLYAPSFVQ